VFLANMPTTGAERDSWGRATAFATTQNIISVWVRDVILRIVKNDGDIGNSESPVTNNLLDTIVISSSSSS
jgi:hypothetical protein